MVFFIHQFPEDYQAVFQQIDQHPSLIDAEKHVLGIDHATIGEMLAQKWNFPPSLCTAIGSHHDIPDHVEPNNIIHLVQLSELINKPGLDNRARNLEQRLRTISRFAEQMKIERHKLDEISCSIAAETIKTAEYLGIDIGDPAEILMRANRELFNSFVTIENLFRERRDLSQRILAEERRVAMMETKNVAIATLSHYINNATMAISGRSQLIRMLVANGSIVDKENRLTAILDVIENSVKKVIAVLYELRDLTNLDEMEKYSESKAINIDDRIKQRMTQIEGDLSEIMTKSAPSNV
jgi:signal transduction histidine kinase